MKQFFNTERKKNGRNSREWRQAGVQPAPSAPGQKYLDAAAASRPSLWVTLGMLSIKLYLINLQNSKKGNKKLSDATLAQSYGCSSCCLSGSLLEEFIPQVF